MHGLDPANQIFNIVPVGREDFQLVRSVLQNNKLVYSDLDPGLPHFFKSVSNGELLGLIGLEIYGDYGLLRSLWVAPDYRNQGLATSLVLKLEEYAAGLNLNDLYLLTETAESFFSHKGYQVKERDTIPDILKTSAEFSSLCPSTARLMMKGLKG